MANTFTNAMVRNVGTSPTTVYTPPAGKKSIIIEMDVANATTTAVTVNAYITKGGQDYHIVKNAPIPYGSSLQVIAGQKIVLIDGDSLKVVSSTAASIDVITSILEDI